MKNKGPHPARYSYNPDKRQYFEFFYFAPRIVDKYRVYCPADAFCLFEHFAAVNAMRMKSAFCLLMVVAFSASVCEAGVSAGVSKNARLTRTRTQKLFVGPEISLLQGDTLEGWTNLAGKVPGKAWSVIDGILHLKGKGGDIKTMREYRNFILDFSWTHSEGGNSGIKYRLKNFEGKGWLGLEYQVLDDFNTGEGKKPKNNTATLYDVLPCNDLKQLNPHTELNHGRIVVNGNRIQHWLNGEKVVDVVAGSERWKEAVAASKFSKVEGFGENATGFIMVQDHQCEVWFHKIAVKEILGSSSKVKSVKKSPKMISLRRNCRCGKAMQCKAVCAKNACDKPTLFRNKCYEKYRAKSACQNLCK